ARTDQEPAELCHHRPRGNDGDAADEATVPLGDPEPLPGAATADELGERAGHVRLEGRVEAVLPGGQDAVKVDDGPHGARAPVGTVRPAGKSLSCRIETPRG